MSQVTAVEAPPVGPTELEYAAREQEPVPRDPSQLTAKQRHQLALDLLNRNAAEGNPELVAQVLMDQAGVSYHTAYEIKRKWRGGPKPYPKRRYRKSAPRTPKEVSWAIIQDFLDAHEGQDFSRKQLATATGVPPSTITALWQERMGRGYAERGTDPQRAWHTPPQNPGVQIASQPMREQAAEALDQNWAFEIGAQLTICGFHNGRILADCDGTLYSLPADITRLS